MSDVLLRADRFGVGQIELDNDGDLRTTSSLEVSVYLSLFTAPWWGNAVSSPENRYTSEIPELLTRTLTQRTRDDVKEAARASLAWMVNAGVAEQVEPEAVIVSASELRLTIYIREPRVQDPTAFTYRLNWDATREEMPRAR